MKILYLDTSSSFLYCGLVEDSKLIFEIKENFERNLSLYTLDYIKKQFDNSNISINSVDKIILVNGPGSFTGIRIAVTIAKTLSWSLNIPLIVISSLQAMACSIDGNYDFIVPIIDARRGFCYSGIYDSNLNVILKDQFLKVDVLIASLDKLGSNYVFISNDNFDFNIVNYNPNILNIVNHFSNYEPVDNVHTVKANYLKNTEAEEKLNDS